MNYEDYVQNITKWRQEMDANLRRENGWLALAGLYWLRKGINLIGSDPESDIHLPRRSPDRLGSFEFDGNNVTLDVEDDTLVEVNGTPARNAAIIARSPPFGVCPWTMAGRIFLKMSHIRMSDHTSASGVTFRSMGTEHVLMPWSAPKLSKPGPGEETAQIWNPRDLK